MTIIHAPQWLGNSFWESWNPIPPPPQITVQLFTRLDNHTFPWSEGTNTGNCFRRRDRIRLPGLVLLWLTLTFCCLWQKSSLCVGYFRFLKWNSCNLAWALGPPLDGFASKILAPALKAFWGNHSTGFRCGILWLLNRQTDLQTTTSEMCPQTKGTLDHQYLLHYR